jgi:carbamoyltransferase
VLEERVGEFLQSSHRDPFMTTVAPVTRDKRAEIPAVVHVDGSARSQAVSRRTNPRFWRLISEFEAITGVPVLLNTSFNVREPIVLTPQDAVQTFRKASFDAMVLEDHLVLRSRS